MSKRWLTTKEAVEYTGLCFHTLKKYWLNGDISAKKLQGKWVWDKESIDAFFGDEDMKVKMMLQKVGVR